MRHVLPKVTRYPCYSLINYGIISIRTRTDADGAPAGGFEAAIAIAFAQPHDAQTGAVALLGMRPRGENGFDHLGGSLARFRRPENEPLGRPFGIGLVCLGHVCGHRAVAA